MSMRSHKDLDVWKKSMDLVDSIYKITKLFPNEELYSLTNQMRRLINGLIYSIKRSKVIRKE